MTGEHLPPHDTVGVRKRVIPAVTSSKTEGHTILRRDLGEGKRVDGGDGTSEIVKFGSEARVD